MIQRSRRFSLLPLWDIKAGYEPKRDKSETQVFKLLLVESILEASFQLFGSELAHQAWNAEAKAMPWPINPPRELVLFRRVIPSSNLLNRLCDTPTFQLFTNNIGRKSRTGDLGINSLNIFPCPISHRVHFLYTSDIVTSITPDSSHASSMVINCLFLCWQL